MNDIVDNAVLPLQVRRRNSQKAVSRSSSSKRRSEEAFRSRSLPRTRSQRQPKMEQFTPPLTPSSSNESLTPSGSPTSLHFHDYVRALYAYHPPYDRSSDTVTLPLNRGDIFLIHSIHPSGWADGTLLDSGIRGWLPTNYCEAYSPGYMRNLLNALNQLHEIIPNCARNDCSVIANLEYTRPMVAGVRFLLDNTKCLGRDERLVTAQTGSNGLRRYRKGMLGELSTFLRYAEDVARALKDEHMGAELDGHCNQLMLMACRIVLRAAKFLDIWTEEASQHSMLSIQVSAKDKLTSQLLHTVPPTPPADQYDFESSPRDFESQVEVPSDFSQTPTQTATSLASANSVTEDEQTSEPTEIGRQFPIRGASLAQRSRPVSMQNVRRASYRVSLVTRSNGANFANSALNRLLATYGRVNENLMSFGTISPGVSTPNDVLLATGETLQSGRQMLKVVDAVCDRSPRHHALEHAREQMYRQLQDLVFVARQVFDENSPIPVDERMSPMSLQRVSDCATQCVRTAYECSSASQRIMERIGDFDLEDSTSVPKPAPPAEAPTESSPTIVADESVTVENEEADADVSETQEPLDVSEFPMPGVGAPALPPLDTGVVSPMDGTTPVSASTVADTPASPHGSITFTANILTPCTPLSVHALKAEECSPTSEEHDMAGSNKVVSTPTSPSASTRNSIHSATTIDSSMETSPESSFDSSLTPCDSVDEIERTIQAKTYAHELFLGEDGQVTGGSLPALVERLTSGECTPDALFVTTFFLTFRIFTTPEELAKTLIERFDYLEGDDQSALPVRLRVHHVLKQWLESHWRAESDKAALDLITSFAETRVISVLPAAGQLLVDLTKLVMDTDSVIEPPQDQVVVAPRQNSSISRALTSNVPALLHLSPVTSIPSPAMGKQHVALLNSWKNHGTAPRANDFKAIEIARQLTLKVSALFCAIKPEELLQREWTKTDSRAVNVKALCQVSNDLINFITEHILSSPDPRKRAKILKHWIKVGTHCLELNNLFTALQVCAALTCSAVSRLKISWDHVSAKHQAQCAGLTRVFNPHCNQRAYRHRLDACAGAAVPFIGTHQTDLFHIDDHNRDTLPAPNNFFAPVIINFEKHMKTARIIIDMQRFQIAYRLEEVPDLQSWLQEQLVQHRTKGTPATLAFQQEQYDRSILLEPRTPDTTTANSA